MHTISSLFDNAVEKAGDKVWLRFEDSTFTYEEAHDRIVAAAAYLEDLGVGRSTHVLATAGNSPGYLFTWLALMRLGGVFIAVNPKSSTDELRGLVQQVGPRVVVTDDDLLGAVRQSVEVGAAAPRLVTPPRAFERRPERRGE